MERRRHPWIYDNEIVEGPDAGFENGGLVCVQDFRGRATGVGYLNQRSKIAFRYLSRNPEETIDTAFWRARVEAAYRFRVARYAGRGGLPTAYRLIHGEADGIPGLTVDIYAGYAVCQFLALGLEPWRDDLVAAIAEIAQTKGIYERSDSTIRNLEGMEQKVGRLAGEEPPDLLEMHDGGAYLLADIKKGAKTGLFLDQLDNHKAVALEAAGKEVLNCFSYTGLFGLRAAQSGATSIIDVEASESFNSINEQQWQRNNLAVGHKVETANVFDYLHMLCDDGFRTDLIVLDPPAFTKKRSSRESAARGYNEINRLALRLLRPGGVLATFSCSHHITADEFRSIVHLSAIDARRTVKLIAAHGQPPDHPVLLDAPESDYLKCLILAVE
jgi:23S rRNA (cytosine1962-C5)-methyltransferase